MRLFVALDLPQSTKEKISKIQDELNKLNCDIKWVEKENLHLTLKFIGETGEEKLAGISSGIESSLAGTKKIDISFSTLGFLPDTKQPKVLFISLIKGSEALKKTAGLIETGLIPLGIPKENRNFKTHLTIGRFRSLKNINNLLEYSKQTGELAIDEIQAEYIALYKSILKAEGPVYIQLERFKLCG